MTELLILKREATDIILRLYRIPRLAINLEDWR